MSVEEMFTGERLQGVYYKSFKLSYHIIDNLDIKGEPLVHEHPEIYNTRYTFIVVVVRGNLHIAINGKIVDLTANDYLVVSPFMHLEAFDSHCYFFSFYVQNEIANDIYEHSGIGKNMGPRYFCCHHYHFEKEYIEQLHNDYQLIRIEMGRKGYRMQELTLRAFLTAFLAHLYSFKKDSDEIIHTDKSRQEKMFKKFLELLSLYCKKERSVQFYADKISITPKYLSNIVNSYTGMSASVAIDHYVVYRIKQVLYTNDTNIKAISEMYNFPNQSFFGRYFKRVAGMSPNDYLKSNNRRIIDHITPQASGMQIIPPKSILIQ